MRVSRAAFRDALAKTKARRERRAQNVGFLAAVKTAKNAPGAIEGSLRPPVKKTGKRFKAGKIGRLASRSTLKSQIIRLLGLLDAKKNGKACRIMPECPNTAWHTGSLAYHVVPAQRGDSTRFVPENVVWCCREANYGEVMNRSLYRQKHVNVFGRERIERLEALARETKKYTRAELVELRAALRSEVEGTSVSSPADGASCTSVGTGGSNTSASKQGGSA